MHININAVYCIPLHIPLNWRIGPERAPCGRSAASASTRRNDPGITIMILATEQRLAKRTWTFLDHTNWPRNRTNLLLILLRKWCSTGRGFWLIIWQKKRRCCNPPFFGSEFHQNWPQKMIQCSTRNSGAGRPSTSERGREALALKRIWVLNGAWCLIGFTTSIIQWLTACLGRWIGISTTTPATPDGQHQPLNEEGLRLHERRRKHLNMLSHGFRIYG